MKWLNAFLFGELRVCDFRFLGQLASLETRQGGLGLELGAGGRSRAGSRMPSGRIYTEADFMSSLAVLIASHFVTPTVKKVPYLFFETCTSENSCCPFVI